jgi:2-hydroxychromene-2-carboxylate isomerase
MRTMTVAKIEFFFDPISPYSWLAVHQRLRIEAVGARLDFRPVLLAGLLAAHGTKGPAEVASKRAYTMRDVLRIAARLGLKIAGPPTHPFNPLRALRMCIALDDEHQRAQFGLLLLDAAWQRGLELSDMGVLIGLANECRLDGRALSAQADESAVKQKLTDATNAAVAAGVFGVPTFRVDGENFWGEDRIEALLWRLQGNRIDEALLADVLARPASAARRFG